MTAPGFALFDTAIGRCGVVWGERGLLGVQLPEAGERELRGRLRERFPAAREAPPPAEVRRSLDGIAALLRGEPRDLSGVALDMDGVPEFHRRVYQAARDIPPGTTASYGEIAARLGAPGAARAVGQALGRNPFAIVVPCHRVLAARGKAGGFSARGGVATKLRMLAIEGVRVDGAHVDGTAPGGLPADGLPADDAGRSRSGGTALGFDPVAAVEHLRGRDAVLARLVDRVGPMRMELGTTPSVFAALAEAIVHQQLSGRAAATIFARVRALFPRSRSGLRAEHVLDAPDDELRGAGLSRPKIRALRDLARRASGGEIPTLAEARRLDDDAIVERLSEVRGIGRWTAEMFLMFRLGRPDVLPLDDYGVRKGFAVAFAKRELPTREELARRGERWRPYRTAASWYLWRAVELAGKRG